MVGRWINDSTGDTMEVRPDWRVIFSSGLGEGRLGLSQVGGSDVAISGEGYHCIYSVTFARGHGAMNLVLREGMAQRRCYKGWFTRSS